MCGDPTGETQQTENNFEKRKKKIKENLMNFFFFYFFFQFNSKNFLRGLKFRWGVFKGDRWGGFEVGRFKRGADLEHNQFFWTFW